MENAYILKFVFEIICFHFSEFQFIRFEGQYMVNQIVLCLRGEWKLGILYRKTINA